MSLYAEYLSERTDDKIIETDFGFAVYRHWEDNAIFIVDVYVKPAFRKALLASSLVKKIIAAHAPSVLYATIVPKARGSTEALIAALKFGAILDSSTNEFILIKKILKED